MKILGKQMSKWWLLLIPPLLFLGLPVLLMLFFMGNNLAGAIIGPPAIWNRPWSTPPHMDLIGSYSENKPRYENEIALPIASLRLNADGSMTVSGLPLVDFIEVTCTLSGKGNWRGPDDSNEVYLDLTSDGSSGSCKSGNYGLLEIAGRSKPYSLYWVIGDPDSGTGIWLKKEN